MQIVARILAGIGPAWALLAAEPGHAQTTIIAVVATGTLPGFRTDGAGPWLK